VKTETVLV